MCCRPFWRRALAVWVVIIAAETAHGAFRQWLLVPIVGDLSARQIGVAIGSAIILVVALVFSRWLGARTLREQLAVGSSWVLLTVAFEAALGASLGLTPERMLADYDPRRGGFMLLGLLFMLLAPALAAWLRRAGNGRSQ